MDHSKMECLTNAYQTAEIMCKATKENTPIKRRPAITEGQS